MSKLVRDGKPAPPSRLVLRQHDTGSTRNPEETGSVSSVREVRACELDTVLVEKRIEAAAAHVCKPAGLAEELCDTLSLARARTPRTEAARHYFPVFLFCFCRRYAAKSSSSRFASSVSPR